MSNREWTDDDKRMALRGFEALDPDMAGFMAALDSDLRDGLLTGALDTADENRRRKQEAQRRHVTDILINRKRRSGEG